MIKFKISNSLEQKINLVANSYTTDTQRRIRELLSENYRLTWSSRGSNLGGSPWTDKQGRPVDLVQTGSLYADMIGLRYVQVTQRSIEISSGRSWGGYLDNRYPYLRPSKRVTAEIAKAYISPLRLIFQD